MAGGEALRKFVAPEIVFGEGALELSGRFSRNLGGRRILVVSDPGVIAAGWTEKARKSLEEAHLSVVVYENVRSNPSTASVMEGASVFVREQCDMILAVGGGSPMDCAKAIGAVVSNEQHVLKFEGVDNVSLPPPPLVCVPTTAGSAADVSQFAIITDEVRKVKFAIISKTMVPDVALIDPRTTVTMEKELTVATGMDALTHAVEAYVSNASSPLTDLHALETVRLVARHLPGAAAELDNLEHRRGMMLASLYAGLAFSNAGLGMVHALAHSLGGALDLPHGECNALLLRHGCAANYSAVPERFARILQAFKEGESMASMSPVAPTPPEKVLEELVARVGVLGDISGIAVRLRDFGLRREDIPRIARFAYQDPCLLTNPRHLDAAELEEVLHGAW